MERVCLSRRLGISVLAVLSVTAAVQAAGGVAARIEAARAELVEGVSTIDCDGLPGAFVCLTDEAFGIVAAKNYDGTIHPVAVGAFCGKGRVAALGHPNFIMSAAFKGDTGRFLKNTATWLLRGRPGKVAVVNHDGLAAALTAAGVPVEKVPSFAAAYAYPALACASGATPSAEFARLRDYVKKGGGLLSEALTWGWKYFAERSSGLVSPALHYDAEKLFAPFGFVATDLGVNRSGKAGLGFDTAVAFPYGSTLPEALRAVKSGAVATNDALRAQVAKTLVQAVDACPPDAGKPIAALRALADTPAARKSPSPSSPLRAEDYLARVATVLRRNAWLKDPTRPCAADPAAAVYPGLPAKGAKTVANAKVKVDLTVPRWKSTGLFAVAGTPVTVRLAPGAEKLGLKLRVGTTADDLTSVAEWKRAPVVTATIPLDKARTSICTPFGGLLYVDVPWGQKGETTVTFAGAIRAAHFVNGRDTNADWPRILKESAAPQAEIEGDRYVITLRRLKAERATDPEGAVAIWDRAIACAEELTGLAEPRPYKERICADVQLASGWLHDGYPMMYHDVTDDPDSIVQPDVIRKQGIWGVLHEMGHNYQNRAWTFGGTEEVTVNIFTVYATETVLGITDRNRIGDFTAPEACRRRAREWVANGRSFDQWKRNYYIALDTFLRIRYAYGWEPFKRMFREYHAPVVGKLPGNDQEKIDQWATRLSRILNVNLADYFKAWSWPLSDAASEACAAYPKPDAKAAEILYADL